MQTIDFAQINPHGGSKNNGFEELVCQIARARPPTDHDCFERIEGAGGDGGVEALWHLSDGSKHGFQAKFHLATKDIDWPKIDESVKTAFKQHPELTKYVVAIPCDLTGRSGAKERGNPGWEKWRDRVKKWTEWATDLGMTVEFEPWSASEILTYVLQLPNHRGVLAYFFEEIAFNKKKSKRLFSKAERDLDHRFQPGDHVGTSNERLFHGLARSPIFLQKVGELIPPSSEFDVQDREDGCRKLGLAVDAAVFSGLRESLAKLMEICDRFPSQELNPFPVEAWLSSVRGYKKNLAIIRTAHRSAKEDLQGDTTLGEVDKLNTHIQQAERWEGHYGKLGSPFSPIFMADAQRLCIFSGEAGAGKSHLLASQVIDCLENDGVGLLLLGQYFSGYDLKKEFVENLDLVGTSFEDAISHLSSAAQQTGKRAIIAIDALNEVQTLRPMLSQIAGFIGALLDDPWLSVVVSLRKEYLPLLPDGLKAKAVVVNEFGLRTEEEREQAARVYLDKRGIARPSVPWFSPEFNNFLFLKTTSDSLQRLGLSAFPKGLNTTLNVFSFYLESIHRNLTAKFPVQNFSARRLKAAIAAVASEMAIRGQDFLSSDELQDVLSEQMGSLGPAEEQNWLDALKKEGVLRLEHLLNGVSDDPFSDYQEVYKFTYQRFSDHLIVRASLDRIEDIETAFVRSSDLAAFFYRDDHWAVSSLWSAFAIQVPEKFPGYELVDLLAFDDDEWGVDQTLSDATTESFLWRSADAFSLRSFEVFNDLKEDYQDPRINILFKLALSMKHPLNADFLHKSLLPRPLAERDAFWSVEINNCSDDRTHPVWTLMDWCLSADISTIDEEVLRLAGLSICWLFTSSSAPIRDTATKSLVRLLAERPTILREILTEFSAVDDPYVHERIYAAAFGAVVRLQKETVQAFATSIYDGAFQANCPVCLNSRDYARAILDYSQEIGCSPLGVAEDSWRPPYGSSSVDLDVTEEEIEAIAKKAGDGSILHSAFSWGGDFGKYEIEPKVRHFTNIRLTELKPATKEDLRLTWKSLLDTAEASVVASWSEFEAAKENLRAKTVHEFQDSGTGSFGWSVTEPKAEKLALVQARLQLCRLLNEEQSQVFEALQSLEKSNAELTKFDPKQAKLWITKRAYELGWNKDLFPQDHSSSTMGRVRSRVERIGKKYQWIALSEFLARLADNYWVIRDYPMQAVHYDHPANDWFVRNVEPSCIQPSRTPHVLEDWELPVALDMPRAKGESLMDWPFEVEELAGADSLLAKDGSGHEWLVLYSFESLSEKHSTEENRLHNIKQSSFLRMSAVVVDREDTARALRILNDQRLADPSGHETLDWTDGAFLAEYPWRNTWGGSQPDFDSYDRFLNDVKYLRPVVSRVWEGHLDASFEDGHTQHVFHPWISRKAELSISFEKDGEIFQRNTKQTVFICVEDGSRRSLVLVKRDFWDSFLKENGLACVWIFGGERDAFVGHDGFASRSFSATYVIGREGFTGESWFEDNERVAEQDDQ